MTNKIGFLAGAFDIIHPGYAELFRDAKEHCDYLIVAIQDDPTVERPKIKYKPIFSQSERASILLCFRQINEVRFYRTEDDLILLLNEIRPDVRILGDDYVNKKITGRNFSKSTYFHHRETGWSVTKVRQMIKENS